MPLLMDLKGDPFERAYFESEDYNHWLADHFFLVVPAQGIVGQFIQTFKDYPQRQKTGSFNLDAVFESISQSKGK